MIVPAVAARGPGLRPEAAAPPFVADHPQQVDLLAAAGLLAAADRTEPFRVVEVQVGSLVIPSLRSL